MMDYDANLIAVAVGAASPEQAAKVLARVDRGPCTHARGTWVSEIEYDLQHVYGGPMALGDSKVCVVFSRVKSFSSGRCSPS